MKSTRTSSIVWGVTVLAFVVLSAFLCWYFNSGWYVLVLLFLGFAKESNEGEEKTEEGAP